LLGTKLVYSIQATHCQKTESHGSVLFATQIGTRYNPNFTNSNEERAVMRLIATLLATCILVSLGNAGAEPVRAAYPSANVQFLPAFVAVEKGFSQN
jgi:hypothetical protein